MTKSFLQLECVWNTSQDTQVFLALTMTYVMFVDPGVLRVD